MSEIQKQWYVVRAIGGKEGKVKELLDAEIRRSHLEEYISQVLIPTEKVYTIRNGKKVSKEKVSYPGYVLVEAYLKEQIPYIIRNIPNVLGFLGDTKEDSRKMIATPLRPQEVARILGRVDEMSESDEEQEIPFVDFMEEGEVALANAEVTAEAAIAELVFHSRYSIRNEKYIVTGYGRCAKTIAAKIAALGGNVTVLARSVRDRKAAKADGHNASDFSYAPEEAYGTRGIINTVPALVITESMIREMHKDTVILDIASKPGGTDKKAAEKYHIPVIEALGLPGIYTPKSSAKILADCVIRHTLPEDVRKEEKSWIFQIII